MDESTLQTGVEVGGLKETSDAQILESVREHGAIFFPGFPIVDSSEFDAYKPEEDVRDVGRILYLTTEAGRGEGNPMAMLIFRREGFTFNTRNTPEPENHYTARNVGDSFFGPQGRRWRADEIDLAMLYGKIRMEGVDAESPEFLDQVVGWDEAAGKLITMREAMDGYQGYLKAKKKDKNAPYNFFNALSEEKLRELVLARVASQDSVISRQLIERFNTDPEFAKSIIRTETTRMNANISMMTDRRKLPPVALCEVDYHKLVPSQNPQDLVMLKED